MTKPLYEVPPQEFGDPELLGRHSYAIEVQEGGVVMTTHQGVLLEDHRYFFTHAEFRFFSDQVAGASRACLRQIHRTSRAKRETHDAIPG
jgi:hypothetical protein